MYFVGVCWQVEYIGLENANQGEPHLFMGSLSF